MTIEKPKNYKPTVIVHDPLKQPMSQQEKRVHRHAALYSALEDLRQKGGQPTISDGIDEMARRNGIKPLPGHHR